MQFPGDRIEDSREAVFGHAAAEERVSSQGTEGVVADLLVGWRGTLADEVEIGVGWDGRGVEEDEPGVYAQF